MYVIVLTGLTHHLKTEIAQSLDLPVVSTAELSAFPATGHDVAVYIAPESVEPEALVAQLDAVQQAFPDITMKIAAVIDDRTCTCFPNVEKLLREYADVTVTSLAQAAEMLP